MATELWAVGLAFVAVLVGALGPIFIKKGSARFSLHPLRLLRNWQFVLGVSIYLVSSVLFILALRGGELSVLGPMVSLSYGVVAILSIFLLDEKMNALKWVGIACIIAGVSLIGIA
jgi:drug/metabolite transporter (DMT)-like permease